MTNTFTTTAWAFDGSGNNWVSYPKGVNADGKGLENGLFIGGHTFGCPGDLQGIAAEKAIKAGKFSKNTTKGKVAADWKAKAYKDQTLCSKTSTPFTDQDYDYVVNNSTDTTGLKAMKGVEVVAIAPVDNTITTEWDAESAAEAVKTQVATFGKAHWGVGNISSTKKCALKEAALDKSLNAAFKSKVNSTDALSLDTSMDSDWTPVSADPMEAMIEAEEEASSWETLMAKAKAAMTTDEWAMVIAKANGKNQTAIAEEWGVSKMAISKKFKVIAKKAVKATGVAFVA